MGRFQSDRLWPWPNREQAFNSARAIRPAALDQTRSLRSANVNVCSLQKLPMGRPKAICQQSAPIAVIGAQPQITRKRPLICWRPSSQNCGHFASGVCRIMLLKSSIKRKPSFAFKLFHRNLTEALAATMNVPISAAGEGPQSQARPRLLREPWPD